MKGKDRKGRLAALLGEYYPKTRGVSREALRRPKDRRAPSGPQRVEALPTDSEKGWLNALRARVGRP
ncbi:MAG: hypothetical protein ACUVS5_05390 [Anaerolineae bacterium]